MAYRIVRSPERRVFYIDVGSIPPEDVEQHMQKIMTQMKRNQVIDPDSGRVDLRYNPMSVEEDYFIPVRGGSSSKVESLSGGSYTGDIDDIKYLRDKLFSALKIPASYLSSMSEDGGEDKTTLAQKDIRFARTIQRLQRVVVSELEKIGIIHLFTLGYRGDDLLSFTVQLNNPSRIAELQELEHWKAKFDAAASATEGYFSRRWITQHMFGMDDEEFLRNQREMFYDRKFEAMLEVEAEAVVQAGSVEAEAEAMDIAEEEGLLGPEEPPPPEEGGLPPEEGAPAEELPPEEDTALLAEPGNRDDEVWLKHRIPNPSSPGNRDDTVQYMGPHGPSSPYTPAKRDGRETAGRVKSWLSDSGMVDGSFGASSRSIWPGKRDNDGLDALARGLMEQKDTTYTKEESDLFRVNADMKRLIESLERKTNEEET
jgi:hypothetical protein